MKKPVILCIDDERFVLNSLKTELKEEFGNKHTITIAETPEEALEIFMELVNEKVEVPLIISDYIMPNIKGDELLKRFHELSPRSLKIMLTGQATTEGVTNAVNWARLYRYIAKPWESKDLNLTVKEAIKSFYQEIKLEKQNEELKKMNEILEYRVQERTQEILEKNIILEQQKNELDSKNKNITDSIKAAERIQLALLPSNEVFKDSFSDHFILNKPKDIVSGDFYLAQKYDDIIIFTVADCTGHGVPGALMSILGISSLNEIINKYSQEEINNLKAGEMLDQLRLKILNSFQQTVKNNEQKEGMDIALCVLNLKTNLLQYAGALSPLNFVSFSSGVSLFNEVQPDKVPVGYIHEEMCCFKNHSIQLNKGDILYLYSDGYADQFGGTRNKKFMKHKFKELLGSISGKQLSEQIEILELTLTEWKGSLEQVDDILVIGVKL